MRQAPEDLTGLTEAPPFRGRGRYKRPLDLIVLSVSHVLLAPLLLLLWILIPLLVWLGDRGPVFYRQKRAGLHGRVSTVLKFRTMIPEAEHRGPAWTVEGDTRVTRVGYFLRKTALDELPQVFSIWKGDLSFVGPRALPVEEQALLEKQIPGFEGRLVVRPGLTGLAQVYNYDDDAYVKLRYDLEYIRRMSPLLDIKLLLISLRNAVLAKWDRRGGKAGL